MLWNNLFVQSRTTVGQKLPDDWEEKVVNFRQFVSRKNEDLGIQADHVFNMDEVPMLSDAPYSRTTDATGAQSVPISTTATRNRLHCSPFLLRVRKKVKTVCHKLFKSKTMPLLDLTKIVLNDCDDTMQH